MRNDQDLCIHPSVTAIASHVGQTTGRDATGNDLVGERERQIVRGCAIHVHSVQGGIRALHPQLGILRHQENVGLVPAALLVEEASGFGEVVSFPREMSLRNTTVFETPPCELTISRSRSRVL